MFFSGTLYTVDVFQLLFDVCHLLGDLLRFEFTFDQFYCSLDNDYCVLCDIFNIFNAFVSCSCVKF